MIQARDKLLLIREAAVLLRRSERTVRRLRDDGHFVCCKVRGTWFIRESSIYHYIERQEAFSALEFRGPENIF